MIGTQDLLYSFRRCPYAMRARMALKASGANPEVREIILRDKPSQMLEASPKGTVPVLILQDGTIIDESLDIMFYTLEKNDPYNLLACDIDHANDLIKENDTEFKHHLDRYKYPNRYENTEAEHHKEFACKTLEKINKLLLKNNFILGDLATIADIALFPFIRQFAHVDKEWFFNNEYTALQNWLNYHLETPLFKSIMKKLKPWQQGDKALYFQNIFND